jgi:TPR repeat protein
MSWYNNAAVQGDAYAQLNIGLLYEYGRGVKQDYSQARAWYQKAADQGNERAKDALKRLPAN